MAVFTDRCTSTKYCTHINHGTFSNHSTDIDDGSHHDDGIGSDFYLFTNDGTRFNTRWNFEKIQHWNGAVAAVIFNHNIFNAVFIFFQDVRKLLPVTKYNLITTAEYFCIPIVYRLLFLYVQFDRCFLFSCFNIVDDFLCVHFSSS